MDIKLALREECSACDACGKVRTSAVNPSTIVLSLEALKYTFTVTGPIVVIILYDVIKQRGLIHAKCCRLRTSTEKSGTVEYGKSGKPVYALYNYANKL